GTGDRPNDRDPQRLCTGISLVGMRAHIPGGAIVGRNCVIASEAGEPDFDRLEIPGGTTLDRR
ncbi:MAG TPA: glucose-1-phosphate adenylyltransferase, partial [Thermoanaerobaculia bacterium]